MNEILKQFGDIHPARAMDFDVLYAGLQSEVEAGYINKQVDKDLGLEIFKYSNSCTFEKHWNVFTLIARGLILAPCEKMVVATPFPKFFNYGEVSFDLPNGSFVSFEKMDGSLGIVYHWRNKWRVATCLSFLSDQSRWAENYLNNVVSRSALSYLIIGDTYLTEIIYPENRIVVKYDFNDLVLLSGYYKTGHEMQYDHVQDLGNKLKLRTAKVYEYSSIENILELSKTMSCDQEGFVLRFDNDYRLKIKGDEYCRVHRLISRCTPLAIWDSMCSCDDFSALLKFLPEEFIKDLTKIREIFTSKFDSFSSDLKSAMELTKDFSDKELGIAIANNELKYSKNILSCLFPCRKVNFWEEISRPGKLRSFVFRSFRPTNNILEGYTPSNAMNRFEDV